MSFAIADCLFIGVDMQPLYAGSKGGAVLRRIESLRADITSSGALSWQVYMRTPLASRLLPHAARKAEQAEINANHALLFPSLPSEKRFGKTDHHPNNIKFERALCKRRPAAIFVYGFWLDVCVEATARHARELMENIGLKPAIDIIADCGETYFKQGLDACVFSTVTKDELCFPAAVSRRPAPYAPAKPRQSVASL